MEVHRSRHGGLGRDVSEAGCGGVASLEAEVVEFLQIHARVLLVRTLERLPDGEVVGEDGMVPGALPLRRCELALLGPHPPFERGRLLQLQAEQIVSRRERAGATYMYYLISVTRFTTSA